MAPTSRDGEPTYDTITKRDPKIQLVIWLGLTAQPCAQFETDRTARDTHLLMIQNLGRLDWQEASGQGRPALGETTTDRYKVIIGPRLRVHN